MNENWVNDMRRKMEGHRMDPPPGLWEGICERMGMEPEPVPVRKSAAIRRWYWAAAAVVLALVGFFAYHHLGDDGPVAETREAVMVSNEAGKVSGEPEMQVLPKAAVIDSLPSRPLLAVQSYKKDAKTPAPEEEAVSEQREELTASAELVEADGTPEGSPRDSVEQHHEPVPMVPDAPSYPEPSYATRKSSHDDSRWTIGLNASGGLLAANNSVNTGTLYYRESTMGNGHGMSYYSGSEYNGYYPAISGSGASYTLTEHIAKHRLPVRFGLSLHYQLSPRLALLSGVNYTRLSSEFSFPLYQNFTYSQRLHYLGIPFGVAWQLWASRGFRLYLTGGAMVEKCVSVSIDGDYTGSKPWQWSVNAAAGAEYALTSQFGIYAEPSLGYYFSDGTPLEHYYKEHPLAPSIEFGLRMHIGR